MSAKIPSRATSLLLLMTIIAATAPACVAVQRGRLSADEAPSPVEADAKARLDAAACSGAWSWAAPGVGQLCTGKTGEGAALLAVTGAEVGAAVAASQVFEDGSLEQAVGVGLPLLTLQNVYVYGVSDIYLDRYRAEQALYTPQDSLLELVIAPFNLEVLKDPVVWGGILGTFSAVIAYSLLADQIFGAPEGDEGASPMTSPSLGDTALVGLGSAGVFTHVAIGEEVLFRGLLQSGLSRGSMGPGGGWALSSLIFGISHAPNALILPKSERNRYLFGDVPFITLVGSYLGASYMWSDYSLTTPTAVHFWYNTLLTLGSFVGSGGELPFTIKTAVPF